MPDTSTTRIVADAEQSLSARRPTRPAPPSLWPVWLAMLILAGVLIAILAMAWLEREKLINDVQRISGELSNVHARLDSETELEKEDMERNASRIDTLFNEQEQLRLAVEDTRTELIGLIPANEDIVTSDMIDVLQQRLEAVRLSNQLRDAQLASLGTSLDALEESGNAERSRLEDALDRLSSDQASRSDEAEDRYSRLSEQLQGVQAEIERTLSTQQSTLEDLDQRRARLEAMEAELRQLRRTQLALSARLEALQ